MSTGQVLGAFMSDHKERGFGRPPRRSTDRSKVCRNLFGPIDHHQTRRQLDREMAKISRDSSRRWNFDFEREIALPGRFDWKRVGLRDPPGIRPQNSAATAAAAPAAPAAGGRVLELERETTVSSTPQPTTVPANELTTPRSTSPTNRTSSIDAGSTVTSLTPRARDTRQSTITSYFSQSKRRIVSPEASSKKPKKS